MDSLIIIESIYNLHWILIILIVCELLNFSERNIFRDFEEIKIIIPKRDLSLKEMKVCMQKGHGNQSFSLNRIVKAYGYIYQLKNLSCLILGFSFLLLIATQFNYAFSSDIPIDALGKWLWGIRFALDLTWIILRGRSKICHILHALHPHYYKTQVLHVIVGIYLFKK